MNTTEDVTKTNKYEFTTNHKGKFIIGSLLALIIGALLLYKYFTSKEEKRSIFTQEQALGAIMLVKTINAMGWGKIEILYLEGNVLSYKNPTEHNDIQTMNNLQDIQKKMMLEIQEELKKLAKNTSKDENTIKLLNEIKEHIGNKEMTNDEFCKKLQRYIPSKKQYNELDLQKLKEETEMLHKTMNEVREICE